MIHGLETLATPQNRNALMLAEIAALLHNIGKMDPNLLVQLARQEGRREAASDVRQKHLDIANYQFKRFALPTEELFRPAFSEFLRKPDSDQERTEGFRNRLASINVWSPDEVQALRALLGDLENRKDTYPRIARALQAADVVLSFHRGNGPLYKCKTTERSTLERRLGELEERAAELNEQVRAAPSDQKPAIGLRLGEAQQELQETLHELEQLDAAEMSEQLSREDRFRQHSLAVSEESWSLADLLTLFWDDFFYKPRTAEHPEGDDYRREYALARWLNPEQRWALPTLLILSHGEASGLEKEEVEAIRPPWQELRAATAFGFEGNQIDKWELANQRHKLIQLALTTCEDPSAQRGTFIEQARAILQQGLGDTQWPINEITLWDYSSSIAALFKSAVARAVLTGEVPSVDEMRWRFLSVRFDGLSYLSQVHHVTDLLGRRESLTAALDGVQELLEETHPLGNEVYRDERGSVFVLPDLPDQTLLLLADQNGETLETLLQRAFAEAEDERDKGAALAYELIPSVRVGPEVRGKKLKLGEYLRGEPLPLTADALEMAKWWRSDEAEGQEICTVCGVRPIGWGVSQLYPGSHEPYYHSQAEQRKVCGVCMKRRGRRAQEWLRDKPHTTIWADEVVDVNGRFALLIGRFGLEGWLDGTLIPTLQKPASFARVQRCWQTTRAFWQEVEEHVVPAQLTKRPRLELIPQDRKDLNDDLGAYHSYELQVGGQTLGAVWDPQSRRFILTENLEDLRRRLGLDEREARVPSIQRWLHDRANTAWPILEPSGYRSPAESTGHRMVLESALGSETRYTPHIALLTEPTLFMTLIPANRAMDVIQTIKRKYEREMSKVQDRLPLHLGLVIAQRRTPLRAVLEAGQAMLRTRTQSEKVTMWEEWTVVDEPSEKTADEALGYLKSDNQHFARWWDVALNQDGREMRLRISAVMGDGETEDLWYPHILKSPPAPGASRDEEADLSHVKDLSPGDTVYVAPSTFDFEYLDTTARRFEIAYDDKGQRRGRPNRPYLLDDVDSLQSVWDLVSERLSTAQWMAADGLIERKRQDWDEPTGPSAERSKAFDDFVSDTLRNADWRWEEADGTKKGWGELAEDEQDLLERAAGEGMLNDVIDLYHEAMKEQSEEASQ